MEPSPLLPKRAYLEDSPCLDIPMDVFANSPSKNDDSTWGPNSLKSLKSPRSIVRNSYKNFQTKKEEVIETLKLRKRVRELSRAQIKIHSQLVGYISTEEGVVSYDKLHYCFGLMVCLITSLLIFYPKTNYF
jgi:hypothetical protein